MEEKVVRKNSRRLGERGSHWRSERLYLTGEEASVFQNVPRFRPLVPVIKKIAYLGVEMSPNPLGTSATEWPTVPAPGDCDDGEFGRMKIGRGNRSTRRKPAPAPFC
jgi:hypothetical protein